MCSALMHGSAPPGRARVPARKSVPGMGTGAHTLSDDSVQSAGASVCCVSLQHSSCTRRPPLKYSQCFMQRPNFQIKVLSAVWLCPINYVNKIYLGMQKLLTETNIVKSSEEHQNSLAANFQTYALHSTLLCGFPMTLKIISTTCLLLLILDPSFLF